jgi:hypothetical protein
MLVPATQHVRIQLPKRRDLQRSIQKLKCVIAGTDSLGEGINVHNASI